MSFVANEEESAAVEKHAKKHKVSLSTVIRSAVRWFFKLEDDEA
jgi:hypothetical protein